jgi:hypothetical protein
MPDPPPAKAGQRVADPDRALSGPSLDVARTFESWFGVTLGSLSTFVSRASQSPAAFFASPGRRYIVVAVDPAAGGVASEEVFAVFAVCGDKMALLTMRKVRGHDVRYDMATLPLVFVVSLLETIRAVRDMLSLVPTPPFLVVIENNFAYGAAVYMQMLDFLDRKRSQHPSLRDLDIVFATPVYVWNDRRAALQRTVDQRVSVVRRLRQEAQDKAGDVRTAWLAKGSRHQGLDRVDIMAKVEQRLRLDDDDQDRPVVDALGNEIPAAQRGPLDPTAVVAEILTDLRQAGGVRADFNWDLLQDFRDRLGELFQIRKLLWVARDEARRARRDLLAEGGGVESTDVRDDSCGAGGGLPTHALRPGLR